MGVVSRSSRIVNTGLFVRVALLVLTLVLGIMPVAYATSSNVGTTSSNAVAPVYQSQWGGSGQFAVVVGVAVDSNGNVYSLDANTSYIQKFTADGNYVTRWGSSGSGNGQFIAPYGIAIDKNDNIYVTDSGSDRIQKFDTSGNYVTQWGSNGTGNGQFLWPSGVATDKHGDIYVADSGKARIQKFDASGNYLAQWGSNGTGNGQFDYPFAITVDSSDNVYVTDPVAGRVQKFDSNGVYLTQWGGLGTGNGQFNNCAGIATDASGDVYVADNDNASTQRIQKFDSNGSYLTQWGSLGSGDGQFNGLLGIAFGRSGTLYVADSGNNRIQTFRYPQNLGTVPAATPSAPTANLTLAAGNNITAISSLAVPAGGPVDYPLGVLDFTFTHTPGTPTQTIHAFFETSLTPNQVTAYKYNTATKQSTPLSTATITQTTQSGKQGLLVTYDVTDGGPLDEDGIVNGIIHDPVGLGITTPTTPAPSLAATGTSLWVYGAVAGVLIVVGAVIIFRRSGTRD